MTADITPSHPPKALLLPELFTHIATHLDAPDIFQCIQVCHAWNKLLIPSLWHTLDDQRFKWPSILHEHDSEAPPGGKDKDWIFAIFAKYGRHIRHLHIRWKVILNAAGSGTNCTHLKSLCIYNMTDARTSVETAEDLRLWMLPPQGNARAAADRARPAADGPLLSPDFEGVFHPAAVRLRSLPQQEQDWITHQRFWLLIRQNPGLRVLRSHWSLFELSRINSMEFFYDTLAMLPNLRDVDNQILCVDFGQLLTRVPNLQHYTAAFIYMDKTPLAMSFQSLQTLRMPGSLPIQMFFNLLNFLPGLEHLYFGCFQPGEDFDGSKALTNTPCLLKGLHFLDRQTGEDLQMPMQVLPWLSNLTEYSAVQLTMTAATALARFCPKLEVFQQGYNGGTTHSEARMVTGDNVVGILLGSCPNLKMIDAPHHRIDANFMNRYEWVCLGLESLRCQLTGFSRLDRAEQGMYLEIFGSDPDLIGLAETQEEHQSLLEKALLCKLQHTQVYKQLALMTRLRTLDLGYESRNIYLRTRTFPRAHLLEQADRDDYIDYGGIHLGTMSLTLNSGLARLETLANLEVFGFEGVDQRIGEEEVEWMAASWPKLRVLRGLQEDTLPRIRPDEKKAGLRALMRQLRPDVKHEGGASPKCLSSPTMQPTQHPALNLPEVITAIGSFLPDESIVASSKSTRGIASRRPLPRTLERYAHHVRDLSIHSFVSLAYLTAGYKNLRSISFSGFRGNQSAQIGTDDEILDTLLQLVQDNPKLTTWILLDPWPQIPACIWKAIAETTTDLDVLLLNNTRVSEEARPWFLMACRKARQLNLMTVTVEGSESSNNFIGHTDASTSPSSQQDALQSLNPSFSPRTVSLDDVPGLSMLEQLEFLSRCQHLKSVIRRPVDQRTHLQLQKATEEDEFFMRAEMQRFFHSIPWPRLTFVHIENRGNYSDNALERSLTDESMGHILKSIPQDD
ncbi:hypothetical protein BGZ96_003083 [Linnemannia gamsii]|uniref:F-box domain-containing protein n=1 Tax=Linnemannia gamsii TaxID=64522 RepID=A0ABQ7K7B5_9FUNG|nr:hypothetical protein BGZ96_003083 [Linnemannia gamsii]